jgi:cell division protein FtsI/penicillin-binding protein 2
VLASPLGMAVVAGSVANGATVTPRLLVDPAPDVTAGGAAPVAHLDAGVAGTVRALMRGVVEGGTSTVLAPVPGAPVHAKSGTAEFGTGTPPPAHAWMIGFQGDLAFAVLVEGGGFGAQTAGPIAAAFLGALA